MKVIKVSDDVYKIPLPDGARYPYLRWETDIPESESSYKVVEVPVKRFIELCRDPAVDMVTPAVKWPEEVRNIYVEGQNPKNRFAMPRIGFCERPKHRTFLQWLKGEPKTVWAVGFTNGRHRVRR